MPRKLKKPKNAPRILAAFDAETDPFEHGTLIRPFCWGVAWINPENGLKCYRDFWGDDSHLEFLVWLETMPPMLLYAHNGGKFDFLFLLDSITNPFIIGSRIVKATIGAHELRDSFAIIPTGLAAYQKETFDYSTLVKEKRENYKNDILAYLASDCENLLSLVTKFVDKFGDRLTIASTAIRELSKHHKFSRRGARHDETFRPYYLGGRVEFFEQGHCRGNFKVYDVNSMYPHVMAACDHPKGEWSYTHSLDVAIASGGVFFLRGDFEHACGFGVRSKHGLEWTRTSGTMTVCSHELLPAIARGECSINKIYSIMYFKESQRFDAFVDYWMREKIQAENAGDKAGRLFAKLVANSAYGKFAQNPMEFHEYCIRRDGEDIPEHWEMWSDFGRGEIWRKHNPSPYGFYDVAIAASITSASRAILSNALSRAARPIYCDTDSIICESLNCDLDAQKIGSWKLEAQGSDCFIAGKKLYALFDDSDLLFSQFTPVKYASKGVRLSPQEIARVALGDEVFWKSDAPTMKISGEQKYITRKVTRRF